MRTMEERKYYIAAAGRKVYVKKELFDEYNRMRSRQAYHSNRYRENTCAINEEVCSYTAEGPEEELIKDQAREELICALRLLDDEEKEVIRLIFFEDMTERKAAEVMETKQYRVHRIKERALKKLREKINLK